MADNFIPEYAYDELLGKQPSPLAVGKYQKRQQVEAAAAAEKQALEKQRIRLEIEEMTKAQNAAMMAGQGLENRTRTMGGLAHNAGLNSPQKAAYLSAIGGVQPLGPIGIEGQPANPRPEQVRREQEAKYFAKRQAARANG